MASLRFCTGEMIRVDVLGSLGGPYVGWFLLVAVLEWGRCIIPEVIDAKIS